MSSRTAGAKKKPKRRTKQLKKKKKKKSSAFSDAIEEKELVRLLFEQAKIESWNKLRSQRRQQDNNGSKHQQALQEACVCPKCGGAPFSRRACAVYGKRFCFETSAVSRASHWSEETGLPLSTILYYEFGQKYDSQAPELLGTLLQKDISLPGGNVGRGGLNSLATLDQKGRGSDNPLRVKLHLRKDGTFFMKQTSLCPLPAVHPFIIANFPKEAILPADVNVFASSGGEEEAKKDSFLQGGNRISPFVNFLHAMSLFHGYPANPLTIDTHISDEPEEGATSSASSKPKESLSYTDYVSMSEEGVRTIFGPWMASIVIHGRWYYTELGTKSSVGDTAETDGPDAPSTDGPGIARASEGNHLHSHSSSNGSGSDSDEASVSGSVDPDVSTVKTPERDTGMVCGTPGPGTVHLVYERYRWLFESLHAPNYKQTFVSQRSGQTCGVHRLFNVRREVHRDSSQRKTEVFKDAEVKLEPPVPAGETGKATGPGDDKKAKKAPQKGKKGGSRGKSGKQSSAGAKKKTSGASGGAVPRVLEPDHVPNCFSEYMHPPSVLCESLEEFCASTAMGNVYYGFDPRLASTSDRVVIRSDGLPAKLTVTEQEAGEMGAYPLFTSPFLGHCVDGGVSVGHEFLDVDTDEAGRPVQYARTVDQIPLSDELEDALATSEAQEGKEAPGVRHARLSRFDVNEFCKRTYRQDRPMEGPVDGLLDALTLRGSWLNFNEVVMHEMLVEETRFEGITLRNSPAILSPDTDLRSIVLETSSASLFEGASPSQQGRTVVSPQDADCRVARHNGPYVLLTRNEFSAQKQDRSRVTRYYATPPPFRSFILPSLVSTHGQTFSLSEFDWSHSDFMDELSLEHERK